MSITDGNLQRRYKETGVIPEKDITQLIALSQQEPILELNLSSINLVSLSANVTNLTNLYLSENELTDIPSTIGNLTNGSQQQ